MKNVKNLMLGIAMLLSLAGFAPEIAAHSFVTTRVIPFDSGSVGVIQGRIAADVIMTVKGEVELILTDEEGVIVFKTIVPEDVREYRIDKTQFELGNYELVAATKEGDFFFHIRVE